MTEWTIGLAIASALFALAGIAFTIAGYLSAKGEAEQPPDYVDIAHIRRVIGRFVLGAKLWQTYLGVALTAVGVLFGAASDIVGALA